MLIPRLPTEYAKSEQNQDGVVAAPAARRCLPVRQLAGLAFNLSWWAYSFPLAAFTRAAVLMQGQQPELFHLALAYALLLLLTLTVLGLLARTLWRLARGRLLPD